MNDPKRDLLIQVLAKEIASLAKATRGFEKTFQKAQSITVSEDMDDSDLDVCEALVSRFARLCDLLVKRILRLISEIELADSTTTIDLINFAEKYEIIYEGFPYRDIRELRNKIVHEYEDSEFVLIIKDVISKALDLIKACHETSKYSQKYLKH